jgi:hypothetical protein
LGVNGERLRAGTASKSVVAVESFVLPVASLISDSLIYSGSSCGQLVGVIKTTAEEQRTGTDEKHEQEH